MTKLALLVLVLLVCGCKNEFEEYARKSKVSEARLHLNRLAKGAKSYHIERSEFPKGKVGPTPAASCCGQPQYKCAPDPTLWDGPWRELEFEIYDPHLFQYSYESDGQTFTATAIGDLDCDTDMITYTAKGTVRDGIANVVIDDKPSGRE